MIYLKKPENFDPKFEVVSCFVEREGKIVLLLRQDYKSEGNTWGVPAGKVNNGETIPAAIEREIREETGIEVNSENISYFEKLYVQYPTYSFIYHIFYIKLNIFPDVRINLEEHKEFCWVVPVEALKLPLIQDLDACIKLFYKI